MTESSADPTQDTYGVTHGAEDQHVTAGERPRDSMQELLHPDENVGVTDDVADHAEDAKQRAARLAEDIRGPEGHHPRERL
jgi:hypothetical protein